MTSSMQVVAFVGVTSLLSFVAGLQVKESAASSVATEQYDASKRVWQLVQKQRETGQYDITPEDEPYCILSRRLAENAVQAHALSADEAFGQHLARMRELVTQTERLVAESMKSALDLAVVQCYVAEARGLVEGSKGK